MSHPVADPVRLASPAALAGALPALVGFTPRESLVVVFLREDRVTLTMRLDLPEDWAACLPAITAAAQRAEADSTVLAVCSSHAGGELPYAEEVACLSVGLREAGLEPRDALLVDSGRFWSYLCRDEGCCPPHGRPVDPDTPLTALRVLEGTPLVQTREELVARYAPRPQDAPDEAVLAAAQRLLAPSGGEQADRAWTALTRLAGDPDLAGTEEGEVLRASLMVGLQHVLVRDFALGMVTVSGQDPLPLVHAWVQLALTAPEAYRPRLAGAAAMLLAAFGESTVPVACLLDLAAHDSLGQLITAGLAMPVTPGDVQGILRESFPQTVAKILDAA